MYNDITTFLREMPVKYYLAGGFWSTSEPTLAFLSGATRSRPWRLAGGVESGTNPRLKKIAARPPLPAADPISLRPQSLRERSPGN